MKYKLFITDYDGTLGSFNDITQENISAIRKYQDLGGKFVICTGRSFDSILPILQKYSIKGDIIAFQGATIVNIESGNKIFDGEVDRNLIVEVSDKLQKEGLSTGIYLGDSIRYDNVNKEMAFYLHHVGYGAKQVESLRQTVLTSPLKVRKMVALGEADLVESLRQKYSLEYDGRLIVNTSSPGLLEVINPLNSKGQGVKRIAEYYNIPLKEVITVGDSYNDVELIKGEWHGVAVGNAVLELKRVAKEVTVDFKDNPIAYLLKKYGDT